MSTSIGFIISFFNFVLINSSTLILSIPPCPILVSIKKGITALCPAIKSVNLLPVKTDLGGLLLIVFEALFKNSGDSFLHVLGN